MMSSEERDGRDRDGRVTDGGRDGKRSGLNAPGAGSVAAMCEAIAAAAQRLDREAGLVGLGRRSPFTSKELAEARAIAGLARRVGVVDRVVLRGEAGAGGGEGRLPAKIVEMYSLLWDMAYGPAGTQGLGDEVQIHGVGKGNQMRKGSSGESIYRSGAVTKKDKSKRNTVRDADAFEFKRRIDARLSRLARDVQLFLDGGRESVVSRQYRCASCGCMVAGDWRFCASCGTAVER